MLLPKPGRDAREQTPRSQARRCRHLQARRRPRCPTGTQPARRGRGCIIRGKKEPVIRAHAGDVEWNTWKRGVKGAQALALPVLRGSLGCPLEVAGGALLVAVHVPDQLGVLRQELAVVRVGEDRAGVVLLRPPVIPLHLKMGGGVRKNK